MRKTAKAKSATTLTILELLLISSLLIIALPSLVPQVAATEITFITPTEGYVGTTVRVQGSIDTLGGWYNISWVYPNGTKILLKHDKLPENVKTVDVNITVPEAPAGDNHIELWDIHLATVGAARFMVLTKYFIKAEVPTPPLQLQEGNNVTIMAWITGGVNNTLYKANVTVTDPAGGVYWDIIDITTDALGSGSNTTVYPTTDIRNETLIEITAPVASYYVLNFTYIPARNFSETIHWYNGTQTGIVPTEHYSRLYDAAGFFIGINLTTTTPYNTTGVKITADYTWLNFGVGAHTNYTGTYGIAFNETLATGSFFIGLTNATEYNRFQTVNIKASGYIPGQNVTINIKDPNGVSVTGYPKVINATDGTVSEDWLIPRYISLGTYTVTVTNATGDYPKPIPDIQTFDIVGTGVLTVTEVAAPTPSSAQRTQTVVWKFNITYPDGSLYNITDFKEIVVSIYYNATFVTNLTLTTANCDPATATWNATWKVPKGQTVGTGYNFTVLANAISDIYDNKGPEPSYSSTAFEVMAAHLTVIISKVYPETGYLYNRTTYAYIKFNITYPDSSLFTRRPWKHNSECQRNRFTVCCKHFAYRRQL